MNEENSLVINEILQRVGLEPIGPSIRKLPMNRKSLPRKKEIKEAPRIKPESHNV
ncbi:hypothetical protein AusDCA_3106 [Desulfitobacterium sp. AusDCA]